MAKKAKSPRITKLLSYHQLSELMSSSSHLTDYSELVLIEELFNELDSDTYGHHPIMGRYAMASVESILGQLVVKCCAQLRREQQ